MVRCYICNKVGHKANECLERFSSQGGTHITQTHTESVQSFTHENALKIGESLMMKRTLLKSLEELKETTQRKTLFRNVVKFYH